MRDITYLTPAPYGAGSVRITQMKDVELEENILIMDEGKQIAYFISSMSKGIFKAMLENCVLEPIDEGKATKLVYTVCIEPKLWLRVVTCGGGKVKSDFSKTLSKALAKLIQYVESKKTAVESVENAQPIADEPPRDQSSSGNDTRGAVAPTVVNDEASENCKLLCFS